METVVVDVELNEKRADAVAALREGDTVLVDDCDNEIDGFAEAVPDKTTDAERGGDADTVTVGPTVTDGDPDSVV